MIMSKTIKISLFIFFFALIALGFFWRVFLSPPFPCSDSPDDGQGMVIPEWKENLTGIYKARVRLWDSYFCNKSLFTSFSASNAYAQANASELQNLKNAFVTLTVAYDKVNIFNAWSTILNSGIVPSVTTKFAVLDTGIDSGHPEFSGVNFGESRLFSLTDRSADFSPKNENSPGHGTSVGGIIGANNKTEGIYQFPQMNGVISGITDNYLIESRAVIFPDGVSDAFGFGVVIDKLPSESLVNISMKVSKVKDEDFIGVTGSFSRLFRKHNDKLFVVAAGNSGENSLSSIPANVIESNVIVVGATDINDNRALFSGGSSNFGPTVSISAPGEKIYSPTIRGKGGFPDEGQDLRNYRTDFGGTSSAAPLVTGTAGLIKSIKPSLTPAQIKQILIRTADTITTDQPIGGRLNALKAVCDSLVLDCTSAPVPFGILSVNRVSFGDNLHSNGDILANGTIDFGQNIFHKGNIKGNSLIFGNNSRAEGNISYNSLSVASTTVITGTRTTPLLLPIVPAITIPTIPFGTKSVFFQSSSTSTLEPGNYISIVLNENATLNLKGGVYNANLVLLTRGASLRFSKDTILNTQNFATLSANVIPLDGTSLLPLSVGGPGASVFFVTNDGAHMEANIRVDGSAIFGNRGQLAGSIAASNVIAGNDFEWNVPRAITLPVIQRMQTSILSAPDSLRVLKKDTLALLKERRVSQEDYFQQGRAFDDIIGKVEEMVI